MATGGGGGGGRGTDGLYKVLGVSSNASEKELHQAFHRLAREWHPDKNLHRQAEANEKMKELTRAHRVLTDKREREHYDMRFDDDDDGDDDDCTTDACADDILRLGQDGPPLSERFRESLLSWRREVSEEDLRAYFPDPLGKSDAAGRLRTAVRQKLDKLAPAAAVRVRGGAGSARNEAIGHAGNMFRLFLKALVEEETRITPDDRGASAGNALTTGLRSVLGDLMRDTFFDKSATRSSRKSPNHPPTKPGEIVHIHDTSNFRPSLCSSLTERSGLPISSFVPQCRIKPAPPPDRPSLHSRCCRCQTRCSRSTWFRADTAQASNCVACGKIFCSLCVGKMQEMPLPQLGLTQPIPICNKCCAHWREKTSQAWLEQALGFVNSGNLHAALLAFEIAMAIEFAAGANIRHCSWWTGRRAKVNCRWLSSFGAPT